MFLEFACDKIAYFRTLKLLTKQEIIHSMERVTYEKDHLLCKKDDIATKMFIIQDGIVEVACKYAPKIEEQFVIERLGRGSIINHRSFMLEDDADTDFRCLTAVSCFELSAEKLQIIKDRKEDMRAAYTLVEQEVLKPEFPLALDYIMHNNCDQKQEYDSQLYKNHLRVKLKNAIMQTWSQVKSDKRPPSMNELIEEMLKAKKVQGKDIFEEKQNQEALEKKMEAKKQRNKKKEEKREAESKDSYLTLKQFNFIYDRIQTARKSLKAQQEVIDKMETKMISVIEKRNEKEKDDKRIDDKNM